MLLQTLECMYLFELVLLYFSNMFPGVELLGHVVFLFLFYFWKSPYYFLQWLHQFIFSVGGFPGASDSKESASNAEDPGSVPELERSPGEGNGYPLQYSCLENSMDRGALAGYGP